MNCIFCKHISDNSISIEHIIPESLGNKEHTLPQGIVCDRCNKYFAIKIEKPLLELPYFVSVRHRNQIENKKRRVPIEEGIALTPFNGKVQMHNDKKGKAISFEDEATVEWLKQNKTFTLIVPVNDQPPSDHFAISKLLGKIAIEAIAKVGIEVEGGLDDVVHNPGLDPIRSYVRYGKGVKYWPYHYRVLYPEGHFVEDPKTNIPYEVIHEFQLFETSKNIFHLILIIFGIEYCINLCDPSITAYQQWLSDHNNECPLYGHFNNL